MTWRWQLLANERARTTTISKIEVCMGKTAFQWHASY